MKTDKLAKILSDLGIAVSKLDGMAPEFAFPDVTKFEVEIDVVNNVDVGELMKLPIVSSAHQLVEVSWDIVLGSDTATNLAWSVRLKAGISLILSITQSPNQVPGSMQITTGVIYVVEDESFVPFIQELAVERLRSVLINRTKQHLQALEENIGMILDGTGSDRSKAISNELKGFFLKDPARVPDDVATSDFI